MKILVLLLFIASIFCFVHGRTGNYHHRHRHRHQDSNPSIALPPMDNDASEEPSPPPISSPTNSTNSTSSNVPSFPSPTNSSSTSTNISPVPAPTNSNSTSNNISPFPAPTNSSSTSNNISPFPAPTNSSSTSNSTSPVPSPTNSNSTSNSISPFPSPTNSSSTSNNTSPVPAPTNSNSTSYKISPVPAPTNSNSSSRPIYISPAPSPENDIGSVNSSNSMVVFNVKSFGAVGDGVSDDTEAFKSAWDSACQVGSSIVLAPKGYKFMIRSTIFAGPCQDGVIFQVDGTVMPPDGPDSWPQNNSKRQWLVFYRANGMTMQGGGLIDGKGEKWWNLPCKPHKGINGTTMPGPCDSPVALRFFMSSNLTVQRLRIQNSPQFHFRFDSCHNVTIDSLSISSPALSPNTDGIHVENTKDVGIYNSVISNGDDCISIGAGSFNVDIRNVTCGPSHGISIGSLGKQNSRACVSNVTVRNAIIKHSDNGLRIKTWQGGSGSVSAVTFDNIRMDTVRNPIIIDQYYCLSKPCLNRTANIFISDVSYTGIKGTYDMRSPPIHLGCSDSVPCTNITITDVELLPSQGDVISDPFCWNVYGASQMLTIPPIECLLEGLPRSIMEYDAEKCY